MTVPKPNPRAVLLAHMQVQAVTDDQLRKLLLRTISSIDADLRKLLGEGIGVEIRREQLTAVKKAMHEQLALLYRDLGYVVQSAKQEAAAAAIKTFQDFQRPMLANIFGEQMADAYLRSATYMSRRGLENAMQRLMGASYHPLSESVYTTQRIATGMVDRYVNTALAKGLSSREFATGVRSLIDPRVKGGVSYASQRLARTEINNAFHATAWDRMNKNPWIIGAKWNISSSHTFPDGCDEYAEYEHGLGWPTGVYPVQEVPEKPHPFCFCFITPEVPEPEAFLELAIRDANDDPEVGAYLRTLRGGTYPAPAPGAIEPQLSAFIARTARSASIGVAAQSGPGVVVA